ncbi:9126_t:CDS:1 [Cetraspora pellucida]|uniref:9126_t:CDS:1 n=1 Tax=Cetraspora pellucida TaxID=1433469 RepID=A0A9N9EGT8_9GLOM|nr:9126_t:CDS:1 [Cetraspora pellucida]
MSFPCQLQQRRGPYATKACANCRQKHIRCSGTAPCKHCTLRNIECVFINSGKKRGPKTPSSITPNAKSHASSFPQQLDNYIPFYFIPYSAFQINVSEEPVQFFNQANYVVQDLTSDLYQNNAPFIHNATLDLHNHEIISSNLDYLHSDRFCN